MGDCFCFHTFIARLGEISEVWPSVLRRGLYADDDLERYISGFMGITGTLTCASRPRSNSS